MSNLRGLGAFSCPGYIIVRIVTTGIFSQTFLRGEFRTHILTPDAKSKSPYLCNNSLSSPPPSFYPLPSSPLPSPLFPLVCGPEG